MRKKLILATIMASLIGGLVHFLIGPGNSLLEVSPVLATAWYNLLITYVFTILTALLFLIVILFPVSHFVKKRSGSSYELIFLSTVILFAVSFSLSSLSGLNKSAALEFGARYALTLGLPVSIMFVFFTGKFKNA